MAQGFGKAWGQTVIHICVGQIKINARLRSVLLDRKRGCIYICAEYETVAKNEWSQAKQPASRRLSSRDADFFFTDYRELRESVASIFHNGGTRHIQERGKDGSQKRKEKRQ
jgi:hypothetical protein